MALTHYVRPLAGLLSGGKDSLYALWLSHLHGFDVVAAGSVRPARDSLLFHTPNVDLVSLHAELMGLPLYTVKGWDEGALSTLFCTLAEKNIKWVSVGALASDFQRLRFVWAASDCGLKIYAPLWHVNPFRYMIKLVEDGFRFIIVSAGVYELKEWVGREVGPHNISELLNLAREHRFHPAGEGGEYESFVIASPLFKARLEVKGRKREGIFRIEEVKVVEN